MSFRNASTSSGVGGRPVRSSDTRRISVARSASGDGERPSFSSRARTNASMGCTLAFGSRLTGGVGRLMGWNDQWFDLPSSPRTAIAPPHFAPWSIHARKVPISASVSRPFSPGGICGYGSWPASGVNQVAVGALAGDDHRAGVAALLRPRGGVEPQPALLLERAVALDALRCQDRLDVRVEVDLPPGRGRELRRLGLLVVRAGGGEEQRERDDRREQEGVFRHGSGCEREAGLHTC